MVGLSKAREVVESAAEKVTESAGTVASAISVAIGIAVGAFLIACAAIVFAVKGRA